MADLGFLPVVKELLDQTDRNAQRLLFSATLDGEVDSLVRRYLKDPARHEVVRPGGEAPPAEHLAFSLAFRDKLQVATELAGRPGRTIVFARTQLGVDRLAENLQGRRHQGRGDPRRPAPGGAQACAGGVHRRPLAGPRRHRRRRPRHPRRRRLAGPALRPADGRQDLPAPLGPYRPRRCRRCRRLAAPARPGGPGQAPVPHGQGRPGRSTGSVRATPPITDLVAKGVPVEPKERTQRDMRRGPRWPRWASASRRRPSRRPPWRPAPLVRRPAPAGRRAVLGRAFVRRARPRASVPTATGAPRTGGRPSRPVALLQLTQHSTERRSGRSRDLPGPAASLCLVFRAAADGSGDPCHHRVELRRATPGRVARRASSTALNRPPPWSTRRRRSAVGARGTPCGRHGGRPRPGAGGRDRRRPAGGQLVGQADGHRGAVPTSGRRLPTWSPGGIGRSRTPPSPAGGVAGAGRSGSSARRGRPVVRAHTGTSRSSCTHGRRPRRRLRCCAAVPARGRHAGAVAVAAVRCCGRVPGPAGQPLHGGRVSSRQVLRLGRRWRSSAHPGTPSATSRCGAGERLLVVGMPCPTMTSDG